MDPKREKQLAVTNFIYCGDQFLFLERPTDADVDPGRLNGVGGKVESHEDFVSAVIRETKEETGFIVKSLAGEIGKYKGTWGRGDMVMVFYTGDFEGSLTLTPNIEIMGRSWFDIDNLPEELSPANRRRIEAYRDGVRGEVGKW